MSVGTSKVSEQFGSQMSEGLDNVIWAVVKPAIEYDQVIEKRKWKPAGLAMPGMSIAFKRLWNLRVTKSLLAEGGAVSVGKPLESD